MTLECQLHSLPRIAGGSGNVDFHQNYIEPHPIGIVLTEFHALLIYPDRVRGLCLLNEQVNNITVLLFLLIHRFLELHRK